MRSSKQLRAMFANMSRWYRNRKLVLGMNALRKEENFPVTSAKRLRKRAFGKKVRKTKTLPRRVSATVTAQRKEMADKLRIKRYELGSAGARKWLKRKGSPIRKGLTKFSVTLGLGSVLGAILDPDKHKKQSYRRGLRQGFLETEIPIYGETRVKLEPEKIKSIMRRRRRLKRKKDGRT